MTDRENTMEVPEDPEEQRAWMLDLLINHYGVRGHVIDPDQQRNLIDLPCALESSDEKGKPDARTLKANSRLYELIAYLRERHGLFTQDTLITDCPVHPWFGKTASNDQAVYRQVFRIVPRDNGYLAFTCREDCRCEWTQCPVHPSVPFFQQRFDPFDLLQVLDSIKHGYRYPHRYGTTGDYAAELGRVLGVETKRLKAKTEGGKGGLGRYKGRRYPANKNQLMIEITSTVPANQQEVEDFVNRVSDLIFTNQPEPVYDRTASSDTVWFADSSWATLRKLGAASRLWVYLWIRQQQERGRVVAEPSQFAEMLGVNIRTIYRYRDQMEREGKLVRKTGKSGMGTTVETWTVKA